MRAYYDLHREAELIVVEGDDEFYSATLPLPHVRYCFLDQRGWTQRFAPHYVYLGITLTAEQFAALPAGLAEFEERLAAYLAAYNAREQHPYRWTFTGQPLVRATPFSQTRRQQRHGRAWFGTRRQRFDRCLYSPRPYKRRTPP